MRQCTLFKRSPGVDSWPVCLDTRTLIRSSISSVRSRRCTAGATTLGTSRPPRCFRDRTALREAAWPPGYFHDDHTHRDRGAPPRHECSAGVQQETARPPLRHLRSRCRRIGDHPTAAGPRCPRHCRRRSKRLPVARRRYAYPTRRWIRRTLNPRGVTAPLKQALAGADFSSSQRAPLLDATYRDDGRRGIVFALSNPDPEVYPLEARHHAAVGVPRGAVTSPPDQ